MGKDFTNLSRRNPDQDLTESSHFSSKKKDRASRGREKHGFLEIKRDIFLASRNKSLLFVSNKKLAFLYKQDCFNGPMFEVGFWVHVGAQ